MNPVHWKKRDDNTLSLPTQIKLQHQQYLLELVKSNKVSLQQVQTLLDSSMSKLDLHNEATNEQFRSISIERINNRKASCRIVREPNFLMINGLRKNSTQPK